jgi:hypothetical protein
MTTLKEIEVEWLEAATRDENAIFSFRRGEILIRAVKQYAMVYKTIRALDNGREFQTIDSDVLALLEEQEDNAAKTETREDFSLPSGLLGC